MVLGALRLLPSEHDRDSHGNETADLPLEEGHKEMIEKPVALFEAVDGQVLIGPQLWMPAAKWIYVMKNTSDAKCCLEVAWHLWTLSEAAERSLTGQQCRSIATAARKLPATPEKVEVMKNCLAYFVDQHPVPELPKDHRVAAVRKHLRSFFMEAARQGKRVRGAAAPRDTQTNELQQHPNQ
ncbi:BEN domain-containing protein 5-like [Amblyomma americanum]